MAEESKNVPAFAIHLEGPFDERIEDVGEGVQVVHRTYKGQLPVQALPPIEITIDPEDFTSEEVVGDFGPYQLVRRTYEGAIGEQAAEVEEQ